MPSGTKKKWLRRTFSIPFHSKRGVALDLFAAEDGMALRIRHPSLGLLLFRVLTAGEAKGLANALMEAEK